MLLSSVLTWATFIQSLVIFVRLFTFRRFGARYRRSVSILATVMMMSCVVAAVEIVAGHYVVQQSAWPIVLMQSVLMLSLLQSGGNVAPVLRGGDKC